MYLRRIFFQAQFDTDFAYVRMYLRRFHVAFLEAKNTFLALGTLS